MIYPQNFEQKIGFDQIRQLLKTKCLSTLGEERVESMDFSDSYDEINRRLEQVTEFVRIIQEEDDFPSQYFFDVRPSLKRIRVEGMYMDEQELLTCVVHWKQYVISYVSCNKRMMSWLTMMKSTLHIRLYMSLREISWSSLNSLHA